MGGKDVRPAPVRRFDVAAGCGDAIRHERGHDGAAGRILPDEDETASRKGLAGEPMVDDRAVGRVDDPRALAGVGDPPDLVDLEELAARLTCGALHFRKPLERFLVVPGLSDGAPEVDGQADHGRRRDDEGEAADCG